MSDQLPAIVTAVPAIGKAAAGLDEGALSCCLRGLLWYLERQLLLHSYTCCQVEETESTKDTTQPVELVECINRVKVPPAVK